MTKFMHMTIALGTALSVSASALAAGDAKDAKPAAKVDAKPADSKMAVPPPMPIAPPQEVADLAKATVGTWSCSGSETGMDGKDMKFTGKLVTTADLDGFWVHDSFAGMAGEGKAAIKFKMETFTTWDAGQKKWRRVALMNDGGQMVGTGDAMKDMKGEFALDAMSAHGLAMFKDHIDASDLKKGAHTWGEMSMDKGKTWMKVYDMTCKK
jgi:hypothetical protein